MAPERIARATAVLVALTALPVCAPADDIGQRKEAVVKTAIAALERSGSKLDAQRIVDAVQQAAAITRLEVAGEAGVPELRIDTHGRPEFRWFLMPKGNRLVIDFRGTVNLCAGSTVPLPQGSPVRGVRSSLFALEPELVSRVVLELSGTVAPEFAQEEGRIAVRLRPRSPRTPDAHAVTPPGARPEPAPSTSLPDGERVPPMPVLAAKPHVNDVLHRLQQDFHVLQSEAANGRPTTPASNGTAPNRSAQSSNAAMATPTPQVIAQLDALSKALAGLRPPSAQPVSAGSAPPSDLVTARLPERTLDPRVGLQLVADAPLDTFSLDAAELSASAVRADADQAEATTKPVQVAAAEPQRKETPEPSTEDDAAAAPEAEEAPVSEAAPEEPVADDGSSESPAETPAPAESTSPAAEPIAAAPEPQEPPKVIAAPKVVERTALPPGMDPLDQPVNIDFREMDLSNVVSLLAKKAQVNVIAGTDVVGTVTAEMRNVPLRQAMDMVLRMNGLGIVEEEGIFRIVPYEEAVAARRATRMVVLKNAQADDVKSTLDGVIVGDKDAKVMTISANKNTNVIIISGPENRVAEFERLAMDLDVKEPTLPTITEAIKLNYIEPANAKPIADSVKTEAIGKVEIDKEGRHLIVTDLPVVVEQMKSVIKSIDTPVKQVAIEAMIVDAVMRDASQTGVDWTIEAIRRHSTNGDLVSDLSELSFDTALGAIGTQALDAGVLSLGILSSEVRVNALIAAEAQSRNAEILANPSIVVVENQTANISIVQEFPYQEITQGLTGPPVASTEFKPIGVTLGVTPRITHTNDTIVLISTKQSSVSGITEDGVPIEDKREAETTLRAENGKTVFIGGLRNISDRLAISKVPVLGDIPVLNFLFRNTDVEKIHTELLIFLTCHVVEENLPKLTSSEQEEFDKLDASPEVPDAQRAMFRSIVKPQEMRDPMWKWRRSN